jgi:hypothetical protein
VVKVKPGIIQSWAPVRIALVLVVWFIIDFWGSHEMTKHGVSVLLTSMAMLVIGLVVGIWVTRELA